MFSSSGPYTVGRAILEGDCFPCTFQWVLGGIKENAIFLLLI